MALKLINAIEAKPGATILIENQAYVVRGNDVSKTGRHGHAKCRIEAIGVSDNKKKVLLVTGHERLEVPLIEKKKAQVLSVNEGAGTASVMDLESYETIDVPMAEEVKGQISPEDQVEYMIIEEKEKLIKRKL